LQKYETPPSVHIFARLSIYKGYPMQKYFAKLSYPIQYIRFSNARRDDKIFNNCHLFITETIMWGNSSVLIDSIYPINSQDIMV
jgi:hypothetical protein